MPDFLSDGKTIKQPCKPNCSFVSVIDEWNERDIKKVLRVLILFRSIFYRPINDDPPLLNVLLIRFPYIPKQNPEQENSANHWLRNRTVSFLHP